MATRSAGSTGVGWLPLLFPLIVMEVDRAGQEASSDWSGGVMALAGVAGFLGEGGTKINSASCRVADSNCLSTARNAGLSTAQAKGQVGIGTEAERDRARRSLLELPTVIGSLGLARRVVIY